MSRFITKLIIFLIPFLLWVCVCTLIASKIGELYSISYLAKIQAENREIKMSFESIPLLMEYKFESIRTHNPQVLLIGSSRAHRYGDYLANKCPKIFYNAAIPAMSIYEIETILEEAIQKNHIPKVLLLSLDFAEYNLDGNYRSNNREISQTSVFDQFSDNVKRSIVHISKNPFIIVNILNADSQTLKHNLGWDTFESNNPLYINGDGTTNYLGINDDNYITHNLTQNLQQLNDERDMYQTGQNVDSNRIAALDNLLQISKDNEINVIGFFPPYRSEYRNVIFTDEKYGYIHKVIEKIQILFKKHSFQLYDFTDPISVGGNDEALEDSWHPGQLLSLQIYYTLLRNEPDLLSRYSDIDYLESLINKATDPFKLEIDRSELIENQSCQEFKTP